MILLLLNLMRQRINKGQYENKMLMVLLRCGYFTLNALTELSEEAKNVTHGENLETHARRETPAEDADRGRHKIRLLQQPSPHR